MDPLIFVIFGASGDLTERKLIPAIFHLYAHKSLPENFAVLGVSRSKYSDEDFRKKVLDSELFDSKDADQSVIDNFAQKLFYQAIDTGDGTAYGHVKERLTTLDAQFSTNGNYIFYLSTPPKLYETIPAYLAEQGLSDQSKGWKRLVIEKPFGYDRTSAFALNKKLLQYFEEDQIYRIDHYLGKETVQNLLVFRFANPVFESLWNRDRVESVEITVCESLGVEKRAGYYDKSGALRDMVQNHLTQLLTLTAMEVPATFEANAIRDEKVKVLKSIAPLDPDHVILGQYEEGHVGDEKVPGYLEEEGVPSNSRTETFVALKVLIDSWRWQGVPFYLRTGKRMDERLTKIVVNFRSAPVSLFPKHRNRKLTPNRLILTLQPNEGFELGFEVKSPGQEMTTQTQHLHFEYGEAFGPLQEGYETLLFDVITDDQTLFVRSDEVETSWSL